MSNETDRNNRRALITIILVPVFICTCAALLWYMTVNGIVLGKGKFNKGTLIIPPRQLTELQLTDSSGAPFQFQGLEPKWRLMLVGKGSCDETCRQAIWETRQVNSAMGKFKGRVGRIYLQTGSSVAAFARFLSTEHSSMPIIHVSRQELDYLLNGGEQAVDPWIENRLFLVDPRGWIMMYYDVTENVTVAPDGKRLLYDYKDVMKDLKHLIKFN